MSYTSAERETVITCDDELCEWNIYTLQSKVITKLRRLGIEPTLIDKDGAYHYRGLKFNQITFRTGKTREMSSEQRLAAAERLRKARENK